MSKTAKITDIGGVPLSSAADQDVLHFLRRTLQAHTLDAEPREVLAKLQNLKQALDQQEATLSDWPDSPSKDRICAALAKARSVVARIVDEFGAAAAAEHSAVRDAKVL
jgi:hypothetical protein